MVASIVCVIKSCLILRYSSMTRTCFLWCLKRAELTVLHQWGKRRKVVIHNPQFKNYIIRANYRFYFCCFKKALHARWPVFMPFFSGLTKGRPFQALDFTLEGAEQFPSGNGHFYEKNVLEPCWVPVRHCGGCSGLFGTLLSACTPLRWVLWVISRPEDDFDRTSLGCPHFFGRQPHVWWTFPPWL